MTLRLDHWKTILRLNLQNDPQAGSLTLDPLAGSHDLGCKVILQSAWKNLFINLCVCLICMQMQMQMLCMVQKKKEICLGKQLWLGEDRCINPWMLCGERSVCRDRGATENKSAFFEKLTLLGKHQLWKLCLARLCEESLWGKHFLGKYRRNRPLLGIWTC